MLAADKVRGWLDEHGHASDGDLAQLPDVHALIAHELERISADFRSYERPRAFVMTTEELTPENGMLTPTLKLKRREVFARYGAMLEALYAPTILAVPPASRTAVPVAISS